MASKGKKPSVAGQEEEESQKLEDPPSALKSIHLVMGLEKGIWDECYKLPVSEITDEEVDMLREHNSRHCIKMNSRASPMHKSCVTLRYLFETRWAPYRVNVRTFDKRDVQLPTPKLLLDEDEIAVNVFVIPTSDDRNC